MGGIFAEDYFEDKMLPLGNRSQAAKLGLFNSILFSEGRDEEAVLSSEPWACHCKMLNFLQLK